MTSFLKTLKGLFDVSATHVQDRDARYLAQSTDIYDLERRMRQLDSGRYQAFGSGPYGIFMR